MLLLFLISTWITGYTCDSTEVLCDQGRLGRLGSGVLYSHNYPFNYGHNLTCSHRIYLDNDASAIKTICFTFHRFSLENTTWFCMFDYLKISNFKYCGNGHYQYGPQDEPTANVWSPNFCWTAKGEYFDLLFSTDNNVNGAGFYATYTIQDGTITDFPPSLPQPKTAPCAGHQWTCFNRRCIELNETCNGVDNCGDNSDETFAHARCGEQNVMACDFSKLGGLSDGFCGFSQEGGHWYRTNNMAASYGPKGDHTNGTHGYYVYTDVDHTPSYLVSPRIQLPQPNASFCMAFWYYMYGSQDSSQLKVYLGRENMGINPVWSQSGQENNRWIKAEILLSGLNDIQVTFEADLLNTFSGIALDDISILSGPCLGDDISCNFELNSCGWSSMSKVDTNTADMTWSRHKALDADKSSHWPTSDSSTKHGDGYFMVMSSAELGISEHKALLVSPPVSGLNFEKHCLTFKYHMDCSRISGCGIKIRQWGSDAYLREPEWSRYSEASAGWREASIEIHTYKPFQLVIEAIITQGSSGAMAIDQLVLAQGECKSRSVSTCLPDQFLCLSGQCIERNIICDGVQNCPDNSDETSHASCPEVPSTTPAVSCRTDEFRCLSDGKCIPSAYQCDNVDDCNDGSDEGKPAKCNFAGTTVATVCSMGEYLCSNKKCIPAEFLCDGLDQCGDNSDETRCNGEETHCGSTKFACISDRKCVPNNQKCDGVTECIDGSDESYTHAGCPEVKAWKILNTGGIVGICFGLLGLLILVTVLVVVCHRRRPTWCKRKSRMSREPTLSTISYPEAMLRRPPAGSFPNSYIDPDRTPGINLPQIQNYDINYDWERPVPQPHMNVFNNSFSYPRGEPPPAYDGVKMENYVNGTHKEVSPRTTPPSYRSNTPPDHRTITPVNHFRPIILASDRNTPSSAICDSTFSEIPTPLDPILEHVPDDNGGCPQIFHRTHERQSGQRDNRPLATDRSRRPCSAESYLNPVSPQNAMQQRPLPTPPQTMNRLDTRQLQSMLDSSTSASEENPYETLDSVYSAESVNSLHRCSSAESQAMLDNARPYHLYNPSVDIVNNPHLDKSRRASLFNRAYHTRHPPVPHAEQFPPRSRSFPATPVDPQVEEPLYDPADSSYSGNPSVSPSSSQSGSTRGSFRQPSQHRKIPALGVSGRYLDLGLEHLCAADV